METALSKRKFCPLMAAALLIGQWEGETMRREPLVEYDVYCMEDKCAWWHSLDGSCAFCSIATRQK